MNTQPTPFEAWAAQQGVNMVPAEAFDYRGVLGPEECDRVAAGLLAIAHEMATLLHTGKVANNDLGYAHQELFKSLQWALLYLGVPLDGSPQYRADIRKQYLETDPGPEPCNTGCYVGSGVPANDPVDLLRGILEQHDAMEQQARAFLHQATLCCAQLIGPLDSNGRPLGSAPPPGMPF